jgi:hypothetical protein
MTLKENSNGNYFEAWLQEYKMRLEQVQFYAPSSAAHGDDELPNGTSREYESDERSAQPALANEIYVRFQQPSIV